MISVSLLPNKADAAVGLNRVINFQGKIVNKSDSTNITNNTYSFTFKLYDAASSGNLLWQETQSSVQVTNGIFQVSLGSVTPFNGGGYNVDFKQNNLYLDITFNGETFGTRIQLAAVPQAIDAEQLSGVVATQSANTFSFTGGTSTPVTVTFPTSSTTVAGLSIAQTFSAAQTIQSNSSGALTVGANGATNPVLTVNASTGSIATGLQILGAATGGTTALSVTDSGSNANLSLDAKGSGTVTINGTATGGITLGHATTITTGGLTVSAGDIAITGGNLSLNGTQRISNAGVATLQSGTTINNSGAPDFLDMVYTGGGGGEYRFYVNTGNGVASDFAITDGNANSKFYLAGNGQTSSLIPPDAVGIGPGFITPHAALDVESGAKAGNAVLILNQLGLGTGNDLLSASASGTTKFTVTSSGVIKTSATSNQFIIGNPAATTSTLSFTAPGSSRTYTIPDFGSNDSFVGVAATQALTGKTYNGLTVNTTTGTLALTNGKTLSVSNSLTLSGADSKNINFGVNSLTFTTSADTSLTLPTSGTLVNSAVTSLSSLTTVGNLALGTVVGSDTFNNHAIADSAALTFTTGSGSDFTVTPGGTGNTVLTTTAVSGIKIGSSNNQLAPLSVYGGISNTASLIVSNLNSGDLIAASAGATPEFTVHNDGSIQTIGGNATADLTTITAGNSLKIVPKANTSGAGGGLTLKGGNGSTTAGNVTIDSGSGSSPSIAIGGTNATSITFGGTQNPNYNFSGSGTFQTSSGTNTLGGATNISGALTVTSTSTTAIAVGRQGSVSPALVVDSSTNASSVTGLKIVSGAAGGGLALSEVGGNSNENLTLDAKGAGTITIGGTSTGNVSIGTNSTAKTIILGTSADTALKFAKFGTAEGVLYVSATDGTVTETAASTGAQCLISASAGAAPTWGTCNGVVYTLQTAYNGGQNIDFSQVSKTAGLTIGTSTGVGNVVIQPNAGNSAALIINQQSGLGQVNPALFVASASGVLKFAVDSGGNATSSGVLTLTSANANALAVGLNGATNPAFKVDSSVASQQNGLVVTSSAASNAVTVAAAGGGSNVPLTVNSNGTGALTLDSGSAGGTVKIGTGSTTTLVQFADNTSVPTTGSWGNGEFVMGSVSSGASSGRIWIRSNGANFTFKSTSANVADYSEYMQQEEPGSSEPGDVMVMTQDGSGRVAKSSRAYDEQIAGAYTTTDRGTSYNDLSYQVFDGSGSHASDPAWANVGMVGQIYVKVNMQNGPIKAGDPITTSDTPGIGMKATDAGRILGWTEQPWDGTQTRDAAAPQQILPTGVGMVLVYVHPTWNDSSTQQANLTNYAINGILSYPDSTINPDSLDQKQSTFSITDTLGNVLEKTAVYADSLIGNLTAGSIQTKELAADSIHGNVANFGTVNAQGILSNGLTIVSGNGDTVSSFDNNGNATFSGTLTADTIKANHIQGLDVIAGQLTTLSGQVHQISMISTGSAELETQTSSSLGSGNALIDGLATVSGQLTVSDFHSKGNGLFDGLVQVMGTLTAHDMLVQGISQFFDSVFFHGDVVFSVAPVLPEDAAGFAVIHAGAQSVDVTFTKEYATAPIVNASFVQNSETDATASATTFFSDNYSFVIGTVGTQGFRIYLSKVADQDIYLSWTAVSVSKTNLFESVLGSHTSTPLVSPILANPTSASPSGQ